jgi:Zn finger protein HypA/HybF involved in hydrogenase expression
MGVWEESAMKMKCLLCSQEINMKHQDFDNFRGSINCPTCRGVMELQIIS